MGRKSKYKFVDILVKESSIDAMQRNTGLKTYHLEVKKVTSSKITRFSN
jgi:hypothetical protein